ncbi:hypothetical protein LCGC14_2202680 [marine sediment metagenome]|uniref:Uncharacterized protein n=1 Tax=marine sediment metagenome TaxID=412755 RepID=A0A0F9E3J7_9ZZZZ
MKVTRIRILACLSNIAIAFGLANLIVTIQNPAEVLLMCLIGGTGLGIGTLWLLGKE